MEESRLAHPPPPIPAMARAAMSTCIDGARPQSIVPDPRTEYKGRKFEEIKCLPNKERAKSMAPFLPSMSDSRPYKGVKQQTDKR